MQAQPRILFLTLTNDVGSDRLVSEFGRQGSPCAVIGPDGCYPSLSRFVGAQFRLPRRLGVWLNSVLVRKRLAGAVRSWQPDRVIPLDELAALLLRSFAVSPRVPLPVRRVLVHSLGRTEGYRASCHRVPLMQAAARLGVRTPPFTAPGASEPPCFPLVIKRDHSSGSGGVAIVEDQDGLEAALRRLRLRRALKGVLATAAGYRHGLSPILMQKFVEGRLAMRTVACQDGQVLDGISFEAVQAHPTKRASTVLRAIESPEMTQAAAALVADLHCSGLVSFDFIIDAADRAFLIEMNPRPIGSAHLGKVLGHDLVRALREQGPGETEPAAPSRVASERMVALFPKELERDPESPYLDRSDVIHDVPSDDPALVGAYVDHLVRLYPTQAATLRERLGVATRQAGGFDAWFPAGQVAL